MEVNVVEIRDRLRIKVTGKSQLNLSLEKKGGD
jgi:hypothetical protein